MRRSLSFAVVAALPTVAAAQVRVVDWNTLDGPSSTSDTNCRTVFGAIRTSAVNGVAKRPDVVALQEQSSTSTANLAVLLNTLYGVSSYVAEQPAGQTATDRLGYVYDSSSVELIGSVSVIPSNGTRPHLRAQFHPVGYTSPAASLSVYTSHLNASSATTRATETAALRASQDDRMWQTTDFNRDGLTNLSDFNILAANFGVTAAGQAVAAADWSALCSIVPQPSVVSLLVPALLLWRRRT